MSYYTRGYRYEDTPLLSRALVSPDRLKRKALMPPGPNLLRPWLANRATVTTPVPARPHVRKTFDAFENAVRDAIVGFSDGLVIPFAVTAALAAVVGRKEVVVLGGLAEVVGAGVNIGLGAFGAGVLERKHWEAERARAFFEIDDKPAFETEKIFDVLFDYNVSRNAGDRFADELTSERNKKFWVMFIMDFHKRIPEPDPSRATAFVTAATMAGSYFLGGMVPLLPYVFVDGVERALAVSVVLTAVVLLVFGALKHWVALRTCISAVWGAPLTLLVGALAMGSSYGVVWLVDRAGKH